MPTLTLLALLVVFMCATLIVYVTLQTWLPDEVDRRMARLTAPQQSLNLNWHQKFQPVLKALLAWLRPLATLATEADGAGPSPLRVRFLNAGVRSQSAIATYFAIKTLLTFLLPCLVLVFFWYSGSKLSDLAKMFCIVLSASVGYYLPNGVLNWLVARYKKRLFNAFPDALDLMRVCVQAGLGLDASLERVGREIRLSSPELSNEFGLTGLELRAGASRSEALRHLALRVGLEEVDALIAMLIQADRFGTSISESLQVHAEALRTKRRLAAEEAAAKLPVKLLIPLVLWVFPALLTVLLGPAVVSIIQNFPSSTGL